MTLTNYSEQIPTGSLRIRMVCVLLWSIFPSSTCKKRYKKMPYIGKVKKRAGINRERLAELTLAASDITISGKNTVGSVANKRVSAG